MASQATQIFYPSFPLSSTSFSHFVPTIYIPSDTESPLARALRTKDNVLMEKLLGPKYRSILLAARFSAQINIMKQNPAENTPENRAAAQKTFEKAQKTFEEEGVNGVQLQFGKNALETFTVLSAQMQKKQDKEYERQTEQLKQLYERAHKKAMETSTPVHAPRFRQSFALPHQISERIAPLDLPPKKRRIEVQETTSLQPLKKRCMTDLIEAVEEEYQKMY
jgi:hypothetical protein